MKKILFVLVFLIVLVTVAYSFNPFKAPSENNQTIVFTVLEDIPEISVIYDLESKGFVKSFWALDTALTIKNKHDKIQPGGYYLSKNMDAFQIADKITGPPDLIWITLTEGLRKEQIGERLQMLLGWSSQELDNWNKVYTAMTFDDFEGVYFPDTYLIPVKETGLQIAKRMISHFNDVTKVQLEEFAKKDILWTTGIKIASLIQREAGGKDDMALISGIIWNRLEKKQALQLDATVQYAKGKVGDQWWSVITPSDIKSIDSLYNTYQYKGLPPHPIANPGLNAINAALNPEQTDCFYYLHDHSRQIHCAVTYEEHLKNIERYLN